MVLEIISWPISTKECCRKWGSNPRPSIYQADAHPIELPRRHKKQTFLSIVPLKRIMVPFRASRQVISLNDRFNLGRVKRILYLSPMRAAKVQASLRIRAVSPEPPLLAHTSSESRVTRHKARSLAPLNGLACAVKICHDGMLEDTNSLDVSHSVTQNWVWPFQSFFFFFIKRCMSLCVFPGGWLGQVLQLKWWLWWWSHGSGFALFALSFSLTEYLCFLVICSHSGEAKPLCLILCTLFPGLWWYVEILQRDF